MAGQGLPLRDRRKDEGFALVFALAIMLVLAIGGTSVVMFAVGNQHTAIRSNGDASALSLAQAGIDNAASQLVKAAETNCTSSYCAIIDANWSALNPGTTVTYSDGTSVTYSGVLLSNYTPVVSGAVPVDYVWRLTSTGKVRNRVQGGSGWLTKTIHADVRLQPNVQQSLTTDAWKYIYSKKTGTPGGCDETIYNNTNVRSSMYVAGNLCLNTPSSILGPQSAGDPPVNLIVNGWVNLDSNTNIGTSAKPLSSVHIGQGCKYAGTPTQLICRKKNGQSYDQVYNADTSVYNPNPNKQSDTVIPSIPAPTADFQDWYYVARPGPRYGCQVTVGVPPTFDNNTTNDYATPGNQIPAVVSLTPMSAYDCWRPEGELAWLPANTDPPSGFPKGAPGSLARQAYGQLYTNGTVYIDGSATVDASPVRSVGNGALYVSGTFLLKNTVFCSILSSNLKSCDTQAWEASSNPDIFLVVANGNGGYGGAQSQVPNGDSIEVKGSEAQGALYGTNAVEVDTTSQFQGPIVATTEIISQTGGSPFPVFRSVPFGTPGNQTALYSVVGVSNYSS
jgi:hypothetical protein